MLKALFPIIGLTFAFSANADQAAHHHSHTHTSSATSAGYTGPMPGDTALSADMCNDVCDMTLTANDDSHAACHDLCGDMADCMANQSQNTTDLNDCTSNANRKYALRLTGHSVRDASANSEADNAVVTDADNFRSGFAEDNQKGFNDR